MEKEEKKKKKNAIFRNYVILYNHVFRNEFSLTDSGQHIQIN